MPGGVAIACLFVCFFFSAFAGSSNLTIMALGGLLLPALLREGYGEKHALGLLAASGIPGVLFPPSLAIILYGTLAKVQIDHLFLAGIVPGLLVLAIFCLYVFAASFKLKIARHPFTLREASTGLRVAFSELLLAFIVFVGVFGGILSIIDVAATAAAYVLVVEVLIRRDVHWLRDVPRVARESLVLTGALVILIATVLGVTNFLIDHEVPNLIFSFLSQYIHGKTSFLVVLNIFFLVAGAVLDTFSAVIVVPLICPIALRYGIDPIHFGIIFLMAVQLGHILPPAGMNLLITSLRFDRPVAKLYAASLPFVVLQFTVLLLVTYFPDLCFATLRMLYVYTPIEG